MTARPVHRLRIDPATSEYGPRAQLFFGSALNLLQVDGQDTHPSLFLIMAEPWHDTRKSPLWALGRGHGHGAGPYDNDSDFWTATSASRAVTVIAQPGPDSEM